MNPARSLAPAIVSGHFGALWIYLGASTRGRRWRLGVSMRAGARLLFNAFGCVKYWEIIADNLSKAGWSWGWLSALDSNGRTIFVADAHRGDGKRFVVRADERLTAFIELGAATRRVSGG